MIRFLTITAFAVLVLSAVAVCSAAAAPFEPEAPEINKVLRRADVVRVDLTPLSLEEARALADTARPALDMMESNRTVYGPAWARLMIENNGPEATRWRIGYKIRADNVMHAYVVDEAGAARKIWSDDWIEGDFDDRFPKMRLSASSAFDVPAQGAAEVWIDYPYGFGLREDLWLTSDEAFLAGRQSDITYSSLIFGLRLGIIIAVFAFAAILRSQTALYYGLFSLFQYGFYLQSYGYTYAYVFKSMNVDSVWFALSALIAVTFFTLMTRAFLNSRTLYPRFNRVLVWTLIGMWVSGFAFVLAPPWASAMIIPVPFGFAIIAANFYGATLGVINRHSGAWLFFVASLLLLLNTGFGLLGYPPFWLFSMYEITHVTHLGFTIDGLFFADALVMRALALRRERDDAHAAELAALSERTALAERLVSVSDAHAHAVRLAERRRQELAATSHDMRQPLLSLRLSLRNRKDVDALSEGISYLQSVVDRSLVETRPAVSDAAAGEQAAGGENGQQDFALSKAFRNVVLMFEDEACEKGLRLSAAPTSLMVRCEPVSLMRILTNLTANAIKHAKKGRILIGARRDGDAVDIKVIDTGRGMTPAEIEKAFTPYVSGDDSQGEGLGLAVVKNLAEEGGLRLEAQSWPGRGSVFTIKGVSRAAP